MNSCSPSWYDGFLLGMAGKPPLLLLYLLLKMLEKIQL